MILRNSQGHYMLHVTDSALSRYMMNAIAGHWIPKKFKDHVNSVTCFAFTEHKTFNHAAAGIKVTIGPGDYLSPV